MYDDDELAEDAAAGLVDERYDGVRKCQRRPIVRQKRPTNTSKRSLLILSKEAY